jgi:CBS domain containing-hemolysin-like protein
LKDIQNENYSRIPLYYGNRTDLIVCILRVKDLITYSSTDVDEDNQTFGELMKNGAISLNHPLLVRPDETADKILFL